MASFEELLLRRGFERVVRVIDPLEDEATALRHEVALYDSPHWGVVRESMERDIVDLLWRLVDEEDPVETRVLQREVRRLRDRIERPGQALSELRELNEKIEAEKNSVLAAAGHFGREPDTAVNG